MAVLEQVLIEEMQDLLHAESQLVKALPKMARAAREPKLKQAFQKHTDETKVHVERLKQAFELLGAKAKAKACRAMQGLVEEGQERIEEGQGKDSEAADLALVTAAQKVEHYEIAGYGNVRAMAEELGHKKVAKLFSQTLSEEAKADKTLTQISPQLLRRAAQERKETVLEKPRKAVKAKKAIKGRKIA